MDKVEIISLHKRCNKTGIKAGAKKTGAKKTDVKTNTKAPRNGYHLFLREQLDEMTLEARKNYHSIVSRRWKEIKEDPARLSTNNDRDRRIRDDDPLVQHEEVVTGRSAVKGIQRQPKKAPKTPELVESDDSDDEESDDADDGEPMVKRIQTLPKKCQKSQMRNLQ